MEKQNKVMNIIVNCVAFAVIVLFLVGMFALPPVRVSMGGLSDSSSAYGFISDLIDTIKGMGEAEGGALGQLVSKLITTLVFLVLFLVFAIIGLVKSIILLIKSIKGLSKPEENKPALKELVALGVLALSYVTLVLADVYAKYGEMKTSMGAGVVMIMVAGILALAAAGAHHIVVGGERPLVNRILDLCTSSLAAVALLLMLFAPVGGENYSLGAIGLLASGIGGMVVPGATPDYLATIMTVLGAGCLFVAVGFSKAVIVNGFTLEAKEKKDVDYAKSSIVKSSVCLGLALVGLILMFAFSEGVGMAIGGIMTLVFVGLTLACAIVNKVLGPKAAPKAE